MSSNRRIIRHRKRTASQIQSRRVINALVRSQLPSRSQNRFLIQGSASNERKAIDLLGTFPVPALGQWTNVQLLNGLALGTQANQRVGRQVTFTSIQYRCVLNASSSGGPPNYSQIRIVIVYDRASNGTTPTVNGVIMGGPDFTAPMFLSNTDRFVIISDEVTPSTQSSTMNIGHSMFKRVKLTTKYIGGAADTASVGTGAIWAFIASNAGTVSTSAGNADFTFRLRYLDD